MNSFKACLYLFVPLLQITSRVFFGEPGPWFNKMQMDGDKTTIFHDIDGSVSEYPGAFLVKEDNWLLRHPDCIDVPDWKAAICSGHYAQVGGRASIRLLVQYKCKSIVFNPLQAYVE